LSDQGCRLSQGPAEEPYQEEFCLNFDGKRIDNKEYKVVCLRNSARTLNLGLLACDSGSAENIFIPLQALLDEYNAWRSAK